MTDTWGLRVTPDTRSKVQQAELGSSDLADVIIAGVAATFEQTESERFRTILAIANQLRKSAGAGLDYVARQLEQHLSNKTECLEAGVCPHCGEDVTLEKRPEFHDAPFRDGAAVERLQVYMCGCCGEV